MKRKLVAVQATSSIIVGRDTSGRRVRLDIEEVKVHRVVATSKLGTLSDFWPTK
jgi:hypothetical protein